MKKKLTTIIIILISISASAYFAFAGIKGYQSNAKYNRPYAEVVERMNNGDPDYRRMRELGPHGAAFMYKIMHRSSARRIKISQCFILISIAFLAVAVTRFKSKGTLALLAASAALIIDLIAISLSNGRFMELHWLAIIPSVFLIIMLAFSLKNHTATEEAIA